MTAPFQFLAEITGLFPNKETVYKVDFSMRPILDIFRSKLNTLQHVYDHLTTGSQRVKYEKYNS